MHTTVVQVTPDMAREWLENTAGQLQRPRSEARVEKWLNEILAGKWMLTHQGIALDKNKAIVDGQHRLEACRRSGLTLPMMVTFDVDPETFKVIDVGASRTPGDILHLAGFASNGKVLAAAARMLLLVDDMYADPKRVGASFWGRRTYITPQLLLEVLESERGDTMLAQSLPADRIARALGRTGIRTWMIAALTLLKESDTPEDMRLEFVERVTDGLYLTPNSPIHALRRLIGGETYTAWSGAEKSRNGIAVTITAYNDYLLKNTRSQLRYRSDMPFPKVINFKAELARREAAAKEKEEPTG
jgi:hypothetical protein